MPGLDSQRARFNHYGRSARKFVTDPKAAATEQDKAQKPLGSWSSGYVNITEKFGDPTRGFSVGRSDS